MKLTKPMVEVFTQIIHNKKTIHQLSQALKKSHNFVSEIVTDLVDGGFATKEGDFHTRGSRILIKISGRSYAMKLKELMLQYKTIDFSRILFGARFTFLACVCFDWKNMNTIIAQTNISPVTVRMYARPLLNRGILEKKDDMYRVNKKAWPLLQEFLAEYRNFYDGYGSVKWKFNNEMIIELDDENLKKDACTGFAAYKNYSITVHSIKALCYVPEKRLLKEDIFIHSLFEVSDSRSLHLAMTFFVKNRLHKNKVLKKAMQYDLYTKCAALVDILESKEEVKESEILPAFEKKSFIRVAHMYGVKNV